MVSNLFQPEVGSARVGMATLDGYVSILANASVDTTLTDLPVGVTVTHPGTGLYLLTLDQTFSKVYASVTFNSTSAKALYPQITKSSNTVEVRLVNGSGAATDPSAACGFDFVLRLKTSSVTP